MKTIKEYYEGGRIMTRKEAASLIDYATAPETMKRIYDEANKECGARAAAKELASKIKQAAEVACEALREEYIPILGVTYEGRTVYYKEEVEKK